ncbi:MAG: DUF4388 domain-containing protein [Planctomycetes bacterium]|nr:DUF4388 domain-containing protein [Planctomycetota bacterium]
MSIIGKLQDLGLPEVLQILSLGKRSGVLSLIGKRGSGKLVLHEGRVVYASSDNINRLGYNLVQRGLVQAKDLDYALQMQNDFKKPLGSILLVLGFITREVLSQEIKNHIVKAFQDFMSWKEGIFFFEPEDIDQESLVVKDGIKVEHLLIEQARQQDEECHIVIDRELW